MKSNCFTGLVLSAAVITACNTQPATPNPVREPVNHNNTPVETAVPKPASDTTRLSEITSFTPNETNTLFTAPGGWEATSFETGDNITVTKNGKAIGSINCSSHPYNGPGFALYHYAATGSSGRSVLLVEAQADPGTAWYCAALIEKNRIVKQVFIDEPRGNSEIHAVGDYLHVFETGGNILLRFNKKLIAGYSKAPEAMKQDAGYVYLAL